MTDHYTHTAARYAAADDLCDDAIYSVKFTATYSGRTVEQSFSAVIACDADDAERQARRQCKRDGGVDFRKFSARYVGRAK